MPKQFPYRYRVVILLFSLLGITYLDRISISLVGVRIKSEFHLNNTEFSWVVAAFSIAYAIFEMPSGWLGDKKGQKAALIRIVIWWSLFTALTGFATGLISLIMVRFLFGMGEAGAFPNTTGVLSRWFPAGELSRGITLSFAGQPAGAALAPLLVVPIAMAFGWRATFFVNSLIGCLWVIICWLWFKNNPSEMKGIPEAEKEFIEKNRKFSTHQAGVPWKQIFRNKTVFSVSYIHFTSQWSNYFLIAWLPVFLQLGKHFSENQMKYAVSLVFIPSIPLSFMCGVLSDRIVRKRGLTFGRRFVGSISLVLIGLCYLLIANISNSTGVIIVFMIVYLCHSFYCASTFGTCIDISDNCPGTITGIMNTCGQIGAFTMSLVVGKITDLTHNYNLPLYVIAGILITGSLTSLSLDPTRKLDLGQKKLSGEELAAGPQ